MPLRTTGAGAAETGGRITVPEVAEKVRFDVSLREELLIAPETGWHRRGLHFFGPRKQKNAPSRARPEECREDDDRPGHGHRTEAPVLAVATGRQERRA